MVGPERLELPTVMGTNPMSSAPSSSTPRPFVQAGDELNDFLPSFWRRQVDAAEKEIPDYRHPALPLARIKKVMKNDPEVKVHCSDYLRCFYRVIELHSLSK